MFGQGVEPDLAVPDFWAGAPPLGAVEVEPLVGLACLVDAGVVAVLGVVLEDAAALDMPAAAPPAASAPATIVAPSIFEIVMGIEPPGVD
jgi:hypothetical protein